MRVHAVKRRLAWLALGLIAGLLAGGPTALAQTNRVLALDGTGGHVELPAGVFTNLTSATIEAWVRLDRLDRHVPQRVYNYGRARQDLSLGFIDGDTLWFVIAEPGRPVTNACRFPHAIHTNQWTHIAAISGPGGMRLLVDGVPVERNPHRGSFATLGPGGRHFLGQTVTTTDQDVRFAGLIDEVRVWSGELTPRQIRAGMFSKPVGNEPGLAAYWSFDDGTARDSSPGGHDGRLLRSAQTRLEPLPEAAGFQDRVLLSGRVSHGDGRVCLPSLVQLRADGHPIHSSLADPRGMFRMLAPRLPEVDYDLIATHPHGSVTHTNLRLRPVWDRLPPLVYPEPDLSASATNEFDRVLADAAARNPRLLLQLEPPVILRLIPRLGEAANALTELLDSPNADSRRAGAFLLGQVGVSSLQIVEALSQAVGQEDNDALTRGLALIGLRSLAVPEPLKGVYEKRNLAIAYLFAGLLLPFALIHFLLFILFPNNPTNLYYSLFSYSAAALTWTIGSGGLGVPGLAIGALVFLLLGLRFLYALFCPRVPAVFIGFLALASAVAAGLLFTSRQINALFAGALPTGQIEGLNSGILLSAIIGLAVLLLFMPLEMVRVLMSSIYRRREGAWLVGCGFLALLVSALMWPLMWVFLFSGQISAGTFSRWIHLFPHGGTLVFVFFTSIQLARNFGQAYWRLNAAKTEIEQKSAQLTGAKVQADRAREEAEQANRAKSQFLANVSHELRTPLNAIIGYSEMLEEDAADGGHEALVPDLKKVQQAARHQLTLINDILDLAKIEAGKMSLTVEEFDLARLADDVIATVATLAARNRNRLELHCPPTLGPMRADSTKVRQILFNLLSNACKFTEDGLVRLEVRPEPAGDGERGGAPPKVRFDVIDTGIGMTPEQLGRVFEIFTQADARLARKYGGTGLGLAISRRFCHMMGGELNAVSETGKGSTFTATLPRVVTEPTPAPGAPAATVPPPPQRGASPAESALVLVIDDDAAARELLQRNLSRAGFRVETAGNGHQGISLAGRLQPDVITLDLLMPGMDGWSVLAALKQDPALRDIPVVIVSVLDERSLANVLGAADYLVKPVDGARLADVMARFRQAAVPGSVLLIEDDAATRELLERQLAGAGWSVTLAADGIEGLAQLDEEPPTVILLDLLMPRMDGFTFLERLRERPAIAAVPVIVLTNLELADEDHRRLNGAAARVMQKASLSFEALLQELQQVVAQHHDPRQPEPTDAKDTAG